MNENLSFSTIAEIHAALTRRAYSARTIYDYIVETEEKGESNLTGSETDYHNLSVEFSRQDCESFAADIAALGSLIYPMSTTLLADYIKYSQDTADMKACQSGVKKLLAIDRKYWNWRTFVFVIDFLKDSFGSLSNEKKYKSNLNTAKTLIEEFKSYIPHEERSYVAEAEMHINQNEFDEAMNVLKKGIKKIPVAPQCCLKLADMYLERGRYEDAAKAAKEGILAAAQDQPTVSTAYLYYVLALSLDAQRMISREKGTEISESEIMAILTAYETADKLFVIENRESVSYRRTIRVRQTIVKMEEGIDEAPESSQIEQL